MLRRTLSLSAPAALLAGLAGCGDSPQDSADDEIRQRLVGTWLRDYQEDQVQVRRVLVLAADGAFRESALVRSLDGSAAPRRSTASGEWLFDGTNLKRHYRLVNERPLSAPQVPFATFELRFPSRRRFVGLDRVRGIEVTYDRVAEGTEP